MNYCVATNGNYVIGIIETDDNIPNPISRDTANEIIAMLCSKPEDAPTGCAYMLRADTLEWELVELPPAPEPEDAEISDYEQELSDLGVRFE